MADEIKPGDEVATRPGTKVTFGAGRKVSDSNYGSYDFHCSMSTEVEVGETPIDAIKRCADFAERVITSRIASANKKKLPY